MLGDLIAQLDRPDVAAEVLVTLDCEVGKLVNARARELSMSPTEFTAGAAREFVERADDELWFQLLTHMRKADDPGLSAVQTILRWAVMERGPA